MFAKLGFWNRLALVLVIAFPLIAGPIAHVISSQDYDARMQLNYEKCLERVMGGDESVTADWCYEMWVLDNFGPDLGDLWSWMFGFLVIAVVTYLAIWLLVVIGRWVLRGRDVTPRADN